MIDSGCWAPCIHAAARMVAAIALIIVAMLMLLRPVVTMALVPMLVLMLMLRSWALQHRRPKAVPIHGAHPPRKIYLFLCLICLPMDARNYFDANFSRLLIAKRVE
jgi:uncharacterized membrane protein YdfJ with MMPL/SSD domain